MDGSDADAAGAARWSQRLGRGLIVAGVVVGGVAIVLAAILLIAGGSAGPRSAGAGAPAAPAPAGERFGVSVNRLFNDGSYSAQQIEVQLAALRTTGTTIARSDALWEATEPTPPVGGRHRYVWGFD